MICPSSYYQPGTLSTDVTVTNPAACNLYQPSTSSAIVTVTVPSTYNLYQPNKSSTVAGVTVPAALLLDTGTQHCVKNC